MKCIVVFCIVGFALVGICSFAQPMEGPYLVLESESSSFQSPRVEPLNLDSLAIFFQDDSLIEVAAFALDSAATTGPLRIVGGGGELTHTIIASDRSFRFDAESRCALLVLSVEGSLEQYHCVLEVDGAFVDVLADDFILHCNEYGCRSNFRRSLGSSGEGWFITLINEGGDNPIGEWNATPYYVSVSPASTDSFHWVNCYHSFDFDHCGSGPNYFQCTQTAAGPLFLYQIVSGYETVLLFPDSLAMFDPFEETQGWELGCSISPFDFQQTRSNRLIAFSGKEAWEYDGEYTPQGVATFDTSGLCEIVMLPEITRDPEAFAFHPDFGWAVLFHNQNSISVATVDTNGTVVTSSGVLYWREDGTVIMDADVTLTDDGKVVAVWSERNAWNQPATRLMLAWTDWGTQLDSPDQPPAPIPQSISLSAYPNPFNSEVRIEYSLPKAEEMSLTIYNVNGQLVESLIDGRATAGEHNLSWTPKSGAGVYFVSLRTTTQRHTQKVLYLK